MSWRKRWKVENDYSSNEKKKKVDKDGNGNILQDKI